MNRSQPCGAKHEGQNQSDSGENRFKHRSNIARTKQKSRILYQMSRRVGSWRLDRCWGANFSECSYPIAYPV
jgi:hypothetical protein